MISSMSNNTDDWNWPALIRDLVIKSIINI